MPCAIGPGSRPAWRAPHRCTMRSWQPMRRSVERVPLAILGADILGSRAEETVTAAARLHVRHGAFADAIALASAVQEAGVRAQPSSRIVVEAARVFGQAALGERSDVAARLEDLAHDAADLGDWDLVATLTQWRTRFGIADPCRRLLARVRARSGRRG